MEYYLKKLGHQELGSIVNNGRPKRGRYLYSSKDINILRLFPPLSKLQKNDSALLPIIPLYSGKKVYCNYVYHNDKYHGGTRNEYRIYLNSQLENNQLLFKEDDIVIIRKGELDLDGKENQIIYFLELVHDHKSELYRLCEDTIKNSKIHGKYGIYNGTIKIFEDKISILRKNNNHIDVAIDNSVVNTIKENNLGLENKIENLFNPVSFRDFVMVGYGNKCAVTGDVISWNKYNNLEAAHIKPRSHGGTYLPNNGIAMSRDIHWAFDKGFFTISDDFKIIVHNDIESEYLKSLDGKSLRLPENEFFIPDKKNLEYHRKHVFGLFKTRGRI